MIEGRSSGPSLGGGRGELALIDTEDDRGRLGLSDSWFSYFPSPCLGTDDDRLPLDLSPLEPAEPLEMDDLFDSNDFMVIPELGPFSLILLSFSLASISSRR